MNLDEKLFGIIDRRIERVLAMFGMFFPFSLLLVALLLPTPIINPEKRMELFKECMALYGGTTNSRRDTYSAISQCDRVAKEQASLFGRVKVLQ